MRGQRVLGLAAIVALLLVGAVAASADEENVTCRIDALASNGATAVEVGCLQLDTETYGEFRGSVTVLAQERTRAGWVTIGRNTCTGASIEGVMELQCQTVARRYGGGAMRGIVDLNAPLDWRPIVVAPTYSGGPRS